MAESARCPAMCRPTIVLSRCPFAPSALPDFIATMDTSDSRRRMPSHLLFTLARWCAHRCAPTCGDPRFPLHHHARLDPTTDPGVPSPSCQIDCDSAACWVVKPIGQTRYVSRGSMSSWSVLPDPFGSRLLSCLRIAHLVTSVRARLDTRLVASGYRGRHLFLLDEAAFPGRTDHTAGIDQSCAQKLSSLHVIKAVILFPRTAASSRVHDRDVVRSNSPI